PARSSCNFSRLRQNSFVSCGKGCYIPLDFVPSRLDAEKEPFHSFTGVSGIRPLEISTAWLLPRTGRALRFLSNQPAQVIVNKSCRSDLGAAGIASSAHSGFSIGVIMAKCIRILLEYHPQRAGVPIAHGCQYRVKELHRRFDHGFMKIELQSIVQLF